MLELRRRYAKYVHIGRVAAAQTWAGRAALVGRVGFFAVIMLVFSRLWASAFAARSLGVAGGVDAGDMTWYMAVTELVTLSVPMLHLDMEQEVRSGELAAQLPRPCSYLGAQIAKGLGIASVQFVVLAAAGFLLTRWWTGSLPARPDALLLALPLAAVAVAVNLVFVVAVGLASFWLQESSPLYWVWQKLLFILGGLILPLSFYPEWLQRIAKLTPFAAILYGPAHVLLEPGLGPVLVGLGSLVAWGVVALLLVRMLFARALVVLDINGG